MESRVNYIVVGVFVLVLGTLAVGTALWLAAGPHGDDFDTYYAYADEFVVGLHRDATVTYLGVEVGRVAAVELAPDRSQRVRITLQVRQGLPIKSDTVANLRPSGLTGTSYVDLQRGSAEAEPLRSETGEPPVIPMEPSLLSRLDRQVSTTLERVDSLAQNANALLSADNRDQVSRILADLRGVTSTLAGRRDTLDRAMVQAARTFDNTAVASEQLQELMGGLNDSAASLQRATERVGQAAASMEQTVTTSGRAVRQDVNTLVTDAKPLMGELRQLTQTLQQLVQQLNERPNALLFGPSRPALGPGEEAPQ